MMSSSMNEAVEFVLCKDGKEEVNPPNVPPTLGVSIGAR